MTHICKGVEDLVGCGERILIQCVEDNLVARMSESILVNMELLLDHLEVNSHILKYFIDATSFSRMRFFQTHFCNFHFHKF